MDVGHAAAVSVAGRTSRSARPARRRPPPDRPVPSPAQCRASRLRPPPGPPTARRAPPRTTGRAVARNTAIFSIATGLSRIAGLGREIVASSYFATSGPFSAFTIAFQVPNLVRSLFADAALSAAFVPVFTELLEQGKRKEAFRLASTLFFLILAVLGAISVAVHRRRAASSCRCSPATPSTRRSTTSPSASARSCSRSS